MHANGFHPERKPKYDFIQAREEMLSFISPSARRTWMSVVVPETLGHW